MVLEGYLGKIVAACYPEDSLIGKKMLSDCRHTVVARRVAHSGDKVPVCRLCGQVAEGSSIPAQSIESCFSSWVMKKLSEVVRSMGSCWSASDHCLAEVFGFAGVTPIPSVNSTYYHSLAKTTCAVRSLHPNLLYCT